MLRMVRRTALVVALVGLGWSVGRAQTTTPDFELMIDAPSGATNIRCVRGCTLSTADLGLAPGEPLPSGIVLFCGGGYVIDPSDRCRPRNIIGWLKR